MTERMQDVGVRPDEDAPKKKRVQKYSDEDFEEGQTVIVDDGDDYVHANATPMSDIAAPEFEVSRLHNGQLEFITLVRIILDPDLQGRLWPRLTEAHFASDTTQTIFKRLQTLNQSGRDWPKIAAFAMDPALSPAAQAQLNTIVVRGDQGKPLTHGSITLSDGHDVPLEAASDFEGHVFDLLDAYRITRLAAEQFVGTIQKLAEDEEFDPLSGPELVERAAAEVLAIRGEESIADVILNFGHGTTEEDEVKRDRELQKMFASERPRFKTGLTGYDEKAGGFQPGEVVLLGSTTGGGKCLTGEALALSSLGTLTMEELAQGFSTSDGYTPIQIKIAGENGHEPASSFWQEEVENVFQINTSMGFSSTATAAHRVRVLRAGRIVWEYQNKIVPGTPILIKIGQEMWGSQVAIKGQPESGMRETRRSINAPDKMTPELSRVLGYLVSEGHFNTRRFSFTMYNPEVMADFSRCWRFCFPDEPLDYERDGVKARLPMAKNLATYMQTLGLQQGCSSIRGIPVAIRRAPRPLVLEFLRSLFEGNGYMNNDNKKQVLYTTTSPVLHRQLKVLLTNLGILTLSYVHEKIATSGLPGNKYTTYTLVIGHRFADVFAEKIGFLSVVKKDLLRRVLKRGARNSVGRKTDYLLGALPSAAALWAEVEPLVNCNRDIETSIKKRVRTAMRRGKITKLIASSLVYLADHFYIQGEARDTLAYLSSPTVYLDTVVDTDHLKKRIKVYDLVVPGTNSFSANGMIQHNTAAMLTMMQNMAHMGTSCAMLQLELSLEQMDERISAGLASVNSDIIRNGTIPPKIQKRISAAWQDFHEDCQAARSRFTVYAPSAQTVHGCEMIFKQFPYRVWFIDYVNLIGLDGDDAKLEGWQKLSKITKSFKALAKKYGICIVLSVQVNIDDEGNLDVRYAKAMKEDADIVIVWHLTKEVKEEGVVWWKHLKARQYEAFDFPVRIALEHYRFESFSEHDLPEKKKRTLGRKKVHRKNDVDVSLEEKSAFKKKAKPLVVDDDRPALDVALEGDISALVPKNKLSLDYDDDAGYEEFDDEE